MQKILDSDNVPDSEETTPDKINKKGLRMTPGGRPSVRKLAVNEKYGTSYRNGRNTREIMGKKLSIGKACALLGNAHFGSNIPLDEAGHEDRFACVKRQRTVLSRTTSLQTSGSHPQH